MSFLNQSQSVVKQNQHNLGLLFTFNLELLYSVVLIFEANYAVYAIK